MFPSGTTSGCVLVSRVTAFAFLTECILGMGLALVCASQGDEIGEEVGMNKKRQSGGLAKALNSDRLASRVFRRVP